MVLLIDQIRSGMDAGSGNAGSGNAGFGMDAGFGNAGSGIE